MVKIVNYIHNELPFLLMLQLKFKPKTCKWCKEKFTPVRTLMSVCSPKCAIEKAQAKVKKDLSEKESKDWKQRKSTLKEATKTLTNYKNEAREVFQKWIRLRDKDLPCISCGKIADRYDGGHYFKAELYSGLVFFEDNVHKQCSMYCNKEMHGNEANYRIGLVKKIGEERVKWLEENKDRLRNYKYTKDQLIEIKKHYKEEIKKLSN